MLMNDQLRVCMASNRFRSYLEAPFQNGSFQTLTSFLAVCVHNKIDGATGAFEMAVLSATGFGRCMLAGRQALPARQQWQLVNGTYIHICNC